MLQGFLINRVIYQWWTDLPKPSVIRALLLLSTDVQGSWYCLFGLPMVWHDLAHLDLCLVQWVTSEKPPTNVHFILLGLLSPYEMGTLAQIPADLALACLPLSLPGNQNTLSSGHVHILPAQEVGPSVWHENSSSFPNAIKPLAWNIQYKIFLEHPCARYQ